MHAVIVRFRTEGLTQPAYRELCEEIAPAFAGIPGLVAKVWLDTPDPAAPGGGGVYLFAARRDAEGYLASDLFRGGVRENPHLRDLSVVSVPILDGPTQVTGGPLERAVA
jgi:hypothetical protein